MQFSGNLSPEEMMKLMRGQGQPESCLTRQPTQVELDTFIDRVLDEKDEAPLSMAQQIIFKLQQEWHSTPEAEIYPLVLDRMEQRGMIQLNKGGN